MYRICDFLGYGIIRAHLYFFLVLMICWPASVLSKTLTLDLPEGETMQFEPVFLGLDGNKYFDTRLVTIGKRGSPAKNSSYKERRKIHTLLAGSFTGERKGKLDWLYYMGATEIQRAQWNAVMRWYDQQQGRPPRDKKKLEKTTDRSDPGGGLSVY